MRQWLFPIVLILIAAFASWQAVLTDTALAESVDMETSNSTEAPLATPLLSVRRTPTFLQEPLLVDNLADSLGELAVSYTHLTLPTKA